MLKTKLVIAAIALISVSAQAKDFPADELHQIFGQIANHDLKAAKDYFTSITDNHELAEMKTTDPEVNLVAGPLAGNADTASYLLDVTLTAVKDCDEVVKNYKDASEKFHNQWRKESLEERLQFVKKDCTPNKNVQRADTLADAKIADMMKHQIEVTETAFNNEAPPAVAVQATNKSRRHGSHAHEAPRVAQTFEEFKAWVCTTNTMIDSTVSQINNGHRRDNSLASILEGYKGAAAYQRSLYREKFNKTWDDADCVQGKVANNQ
jgi:hypothetical protein